jgi:hypothetical protein
VLRRGQERLLGWIAAESNSVEAVGRVFVLILRGAHAEGGATHSNGRARVLKDEDGAVCALMLRDAAQRIRVCVRHARVVCAARLLSMRVRDWGGLAESVLSARQ